MPLDLQTYTKYNVDWFELMLVFWQSLLEEMTQKNAARLLSTVQNDSNDNKLNFIENN